MNPDDSGGQLVDPQISRPAVSHPRVILVADDDALFRKLVTRLLQVDGHVILSAADGLEALELSRQYPGPIDLVITDMQMPRLNGAEMCAHLLAERPGIRGIVMSSSATSESAASKVNFSFLPKPFDSHTLSSTVREIFSASTGKPPRESLPSGPE